MMTIVTLVKLKKGSEPDWDAAMRERMATAKEQSGWMSGQLLIPLDRVDQRVIVGTWETRADWEAWHRDERFAETRKRLEGLEDGKPEMWWHEVILELKA